MKLADTFTIYARRCAARTVFRHVRPLLAYRVTNPANDMHRPAPLPAGAVREGLHRAQSAVEAVAAPRLLSDRRRHGTQNTQVQA